jgi:hypothetical protein
VVEKDLEVFSTALSLISFLGDWCHVESFTGLTGVALFPNSVLVTYTGCREINLTKNTGLFFQKLPT